MVSCSVAFRHGFVTSTLQGERPTISTILRSNMALKEFQENPGFELIFGQWILRRVV